MTCGNCGLQGHNRRTCGLVNDPLPVKGKRRCGCCGEVGHNKRTCPKALEQLRQMRYAKLANPEAPTPSLSLVVRDEDPMEEDFILTSDDEYEPAVSGDDDIFTPEVDVATEGYTGEPRDICGLDYDLMIVVGEEVGKIRVKINQDWWERKIHFTSWDGMDKTYFHIIRSRSALGVIGQAPTILSLFEVERDVSDGWQQQEICKSIRKVADILDERGLRHRVEAHANLKPSTLKYRYIRREIGTPHPLWKRTLAEREAEITREFYARRER